MDWAGVPSTTTDGGPDDASPRGFTGHEMLDALGLVHMNGRIYDPLLGRFLSADPLVVDEKDLQSFNRYSYVRNNPLSRIDPSGFADIELISPNDSAHYGGTLLPQGDPNVTTINVHGVQGGKGFVSDASNPSSPTPVATSDIDTALTNFGHTQGNEIRAYICFGGKGQNLQELKKIAASQKSPVVTATNAVQPHAKRINGVVVYQGSTINSGGKWIRIAPDGSVRDYGTQKNAAKAQKAADKAQKSADRVQDAATKSAAKASLARAKADAAKGTKDEASADKKADRAEASALKAQQKADAAAAAAQEADRKAKELADEARRLF